MAEFCTLDELRMHPSFRKLREASVDPYDEEFYQMAIKSVSKRFEKKTGCKFEKGTYTEYFSPWPGQTVLQLHALPVASITSLKESSTSDWSVSAEASNQYGVDAEAGIIKLRYTSFLEGFNTIQVVFVGGYDPLPDDVKFACIVQSGHEIEMAGKSALESQSTSQGSSASYKEMEFLPVVNSILSGYTIVNV